MEVSVRKITDFELLNEFAAITIFKDKEEINVNPYDMYMSEHSPIRTQLFVIVVTDIPNFVHVHLRTHSIGIVHCVKSNREDRKGFTGDGGRMHPFNHALLLNSQSLLSMAKVRFCHRAHAITRYVMRLIHEQIQELDPDLAMAMRPTCLYRGGICYEPKCCRKIPGVIHHKDPGAPDLTFKWEELKENPMENVSPLIDPTLSALLKDFSVEDKEKLEVLFTEYLKVVDQVHASRKILTEP